MKRKLTLILICAAFLVSLCALFCVSASAEAYSGDCGANGDGFVTQNGTLYYYENGKVKTGWFEVDGKTYYGVSTTGVCVNADRKISGKQYFWNDETGLTLADGFHETENGTLCFENGVQVIGWRHADGSGPSIDANGVSEQYSNAPNSLYYFLSSTGFMVTDSTYTLGGYSREFNADHTVKPLNGLQNRYGELYYYIDGVIQTGWHTVDGNTYYFRASDAVYGRAATKWMYIGDKLYYFYASTSATPYALKTSGAIGGITYPTMTAAAKALGITHSAMSERLMRRDRPKRPRRKPVHMPCEYNGQFYSTLAEAARSLGVSRDKARSIVKFYD